MLDERKRLVMECNRYVRYPLKVAQNSFQHFSLFLMTNYNSTLYQLIGVLNA